MRALTLWKRTVFADRKIKTVSDLSEKIRVRRPAGILYAVLKLYNYLL